MKIRNGFVSNSSSSSFIIRGVRIKKEDLAKLWNLDLDENAINKYGRFSAIQDRAWRYATDHELSIKDTRDFFDGEDTDNMIVGLEIASLEDGVVIELADIQDSMDGDIIKKLEENGIKVDKLSTFIQFLSNDNY